MMEETSMGTLEQMPTRRWILNETAAGDVGLFLGSHAAESFRDFTKLPSGLKLQLHVLGSDSLIPMRAMDGLVAAVIEIEGARDSSLARLAGAVRSHPAVPMIAVLSSPDVGAIKMALRAGADDVITLPLALDEIEKAVLDILARRSEAAVEALAPAITVVGCGGGCGATTVATNLAAALGQGAEHPLLVDLDIQFGDSAGYLGVERPGSIIDLVRSTERIDRELVASIAARLASFSIIPSPLAVTPFDAMDVDPLLQVLRQLRGECDVLVVELPTNWSNWSLSVASNTDLILVVVELSVRSIAHARRTLDLFEAIGIPKSQVRVVVNKAEKRFFASLRTDDVETTLGVPVIGALPSDESAVGPAQQQGQPVLAFAPRSKFTKAMIAMADAVRNILPGAAQHVAD